MADYLDAVFGPGGYLAQRFPHYEMRAGQVALARMVDQAMRAGQHAMCEAPCGSGKGVGYCVPALWHAHQHNKRVVICTANLALQDQLVSKDLPMLAEVLPWRFSFAKLKGRNNFLCHDRLSDLKEAPSRLFDDEPARQTRAIHAWARRTTTGDVSELSFVPAPAVWGRFSVTSDDCRGKECPSLEGCFAEAARAQAEQASLVVTNYHMLFAHLAVRQATGENLVLPRFDLLVLDEAHEAPSIAREFFGFAVSEATLTRLASAAALLGVPSLAGSLRLQAAGLFARLALHRGAETTAAPPAPSAATAAEVLRSLEELREFALRRVEHAMVDRRGRAQARLAARHAATAAQRLSEAFEHPSAEKVYWLEADAKGRTTLQGRPLDVSTALRTQLFGSCPSVSLVSATLTTSGTFDFFRRQIGAPPNTLELVAESPFRFREQALLVVPDGAPDPNTDAYIDHVAQVFAEVLEACDGRTLGLFTSYRALHAVRDRLAPSRWRILCQGEQPRAELIREFRQDLRSVLLGTTSFWTGIDVVGEALTAVVIDRLPFPPPDDPLIAALRRTDPYLFDTTQVPLAIIALRQGVGRLIRSQTDVGIVVIVDPRLADKRYGRRFLRSLPAMYSTRRLDNIPRFLEEARRARSG